MWREKRKKYGNGNTGINAGKGEILEVGRREIWEWKQSNKERKKENAWRSGEREYGNDNGRINAGRREICGSRHKRNIGMVTVE